MYNESLEKYQSEVKNSGVDLDKIDANGSLFWERYHRDLERQKAAEEESKRQEAEEKLKREQRHKENMERFEKKWIRESEISKRLHAKADGLYRFGYRAKKTDSISGPKSDIYFELYDKLRKAAEKEFMKSHGMKDICSYYVYEHKNEDVVGQELVDIMTRLLDEDDAQAIFMVQNYYIKKEPQNPEPDEEEDLSYLDEEDNYDMTEEEMEALEEEFGAIFRE